MATLRLGSVHDSESGLDILHSIQRPLSLTAVADSRPSNVS